MQRSLPILLCLILLSTFVLCVQLGGQSTTTPTARLPGARPDVNAGDYPSLQAAIDALLEGGGVVRVPAGKFEINQPLVIEREDVLLVGQGTATQIVNTNAAGQPAIVIRPKETAGPRAYLWRVQLANFRLIGNEKSGHGILATRVNEIFIQGVTVSYHGGDGIRLDHCYEDPRICDSLLTYNKQTGLALLGCHDIVVVGNQFEENRDALNCLDSFNLCMTGNNLDDHLRHGVVIENTYGSVVSGNMIEECQGVALILDRDCYGITVSSNVIAHEFSGGIEVIDAHGCAITGNSFPIVHKHSLRIGPASGRIAVTGNSFSDTFIGQGTKRKVDDDPAGGIVLEGTGDVAISGNLFSGLKTKALFSHSGQPSRRVVFGNNVLSSVETGEEILTESYVGGNIK